MEGLDGGVLGELHCHSAASDGSLSPARLVDLAARRGLRVLAVTDHDTFRGSVLAARYARLRGSPVLVVPAAEVRTDHGDVLVLCEEPGEDYPRALEELLEWAGERGCVTVAAHPFHPGRHSLGASLYRAARLLDAVEAWNSRGLPIFNIPAARAARRLGLPATSGSDAHVARELGVSPVVFPGEPGSVEEVLEAIRGGLVRPVPGLPGPLAVAEALAWAVWRRLRGG